MDRFADVIDMAQAHVEQETALAIERIRNNTRGGVGSAHCIDCGAGIPDARRRHMPSAVRCVPCQAQNERN
jgi:phage/conjugal plasmid C-4 type zinc finger TraR family protein